MISVMKRKKRLKSHNVDMLGNNATTFFKNLCIS